MSKYTPGPWEVFDNGDKFGRYEAGGIGVSPANTSGDVAHCHGFSLQRGRDEELANARLIAAAPDLLNALENVVIAIHMNWDLDGVVEVAHVALKKATNR